MGRSWDLDELNINEKHDWKFSKAYQWPKGHVTVEFYCANPGCPTTKSLPCDPYDGGMDGLCASPKNELDAARNEQKKQMKRDYSHL